MAGEPQPGDMGYDLWVKQAPARGEQPPAPEPVKKAAKAKKKK